MFRGTLVNQAHLPESLVLGSAIYFYWQNDSRWMTIKCRARIFKRNNVCGHLRKSRLGGLIWYWVMPWSHIPCGVFAATVRRPKSPKPYGGLNFLCKPYGDLMVFSSPQGHRKPCGFFKLDIKLFQKPQCRNHITRSPYGGLVMAVRWHSVFTLSWVPKTSYGGLTAPLWRPQGGRTANLW